MHYSLKLYGSSFFENKTCSTRFTRRSVLIGSSSDTCSHSHKATPVIFFKTRTYSCGRDLMVVWLWITKMWHERDRPNDVADDDNDDTENQIKTLLLASAAVAFATVSKPQSQSLLLHECIVSCMLHTRLTLNFWWKRDLSIQGEKIMHKCMSEQHQRLCCLLCVLTL